MEIEVFIEKINLNRFCDYYLIFVFTDCTDNQKILILAQAPYFPHCDLINLLQLTKLCCKQNTKIFPY